MLENDNNEARNLKIYAIKLLPLVLKINFDFGEVSFDWHHSIELISKSNQDEIILVFTQILPIVV